MFSFCYHTHSTCLWGRIVSNCVMFTSLHELYSIFPLNLKAFVFYQIKRYVSQFEDNSPSTMCTVSVLQSCVIKVSHMKHLVFTVYILIQSVIDIPVHFKLLRVHCRTENLLTKLKLAPSTCWLYDFMLLACVFKRHYVRNPGGLRNGKPLCDISSKHAWFGIGGRPYKAFHLPNL